MVVISLSVFSLSLENNFQLELQDSEANNFPRISASISLKYGYYLYLHAYATNRIEWSFTSSKSYIGIKVLVMDAGNFYKYQNNMWPRSFTTVSDGSLSEDSGSYSVPNGDQWYVLFLNMDSDSETTTLTYNVKFDPSGSSFGNPIMIGSIVVGSLVALTVTVFLIRNRRK